MTPWGRFFFEYNIDQKDWAYRQTQVAQGREDLRRMTLNAAENVQALESQYKQMGCK